MDGGHLGSAAVISVPADVAVLGISSAIVIRPCPRLVAVVYYDARPDDAQKACPKVAPASS